VGAPQRQRDGARAKRPDIGKGSARALRGVVLALICEHPGHGYDLAARCNHRLGPAWQITAKDIYPILEQLLASGLVRREERHRTVVYHAEPAAFKALENWHYGKVRKEPLRSDVRARLATVPEGDVDGALRMLEDYESLLLDLLEAADDHLPPAVATWGALLVRVNHTGTDAYLQAELAWVADTRRRFVEFARAAR